MKNVILLSLFTILLIPSCKQEPEANFEKIWVIEYRYDYNEAYITDTLQTKYYIMDIRSFVEIKKDWSIKSIERKFIDKLLTYTHNSYTLNDSILQRELNNLSSKYPSDTLLDDGFWRKERNWCPEFYTDIIIFRKDSTITKLNHVNFNEELKPLTYSFLNNELKTTIIENQDSIKQKLSQYDKYGYCPFPEPLRELPQSNEK